MKFILSLIVWIFFWLIGLLKLNWFLDNEKIFLFWVQSMWKSDISNFLIFFKQSLILPEIFYNNYWNYIYILVNDFINIDKNNIFLFTIFLFYFIINYLFLLITLFLSQKKDKYILFFVLCIFYFVFLNYIL